MYFLFTSVMFHVCLRKGFACVHRVQPVNLCLHLMQLSSFWQWPSASLPWQWICSSALHLTSFHFIYSEAISRGGTNWGAESFVFQWLLISTGFCQLCYKPSHSFCNSFLLLRVSFHEDKFLTVITTIFLYDQYFACSV